MSVSERDYVLATNLARIRAIKAIVHQLTPDDPTLPEKVIDDLLADLQVMERNADMALSVTE